MKRFNLTLGIIAKNEEKLIGEMIDSARDIVDEIILIDSGSRDNTVDIAIEKGAKVYKENFLYDFSELRNKVIKKATDGNWILFLDCDERLENPKEVLKILERVEDEVALGVRIESYLDGVKRSEDNNLRLIKKCDGIEFKGRIYETPYESILCNYGKDKIKLTDIKVRHYGSDSKIVDVKGNLKRNFKIFALYEEDEKDSKYYFDIGNEYGRMEDFEESLENYNKALETFKKEQVNRPKLVVNKAKILHKLERFTEMIKFIEEENIEEFRDLYFLKAYGYISIGKFSKALDELDRYRELDKKIEYPSSEFENGINIEKLYRDIFNLANTLEK